MSATILSLEAAKEAKLNLTEGNKGHQAIYYTVVAYRSNRRQGSANSKTRADVAGSGKKLWNQKGTGNARMGSRRSPIWSGGGVVWGPKPRDYSKKTNRKVRQLALRAALTARINDGDVLKIDALQVADGKTKTFLASLRTITDAKKVTIVGNFDEKTLQASRNVPKIELLRSEEVNAEHLLNCQKVVLTGHAVETLARRTATE